MKKVLFISWDGPQTSYMEGLFMPIFNEIKRQSNFEFHIIQFTWAKADKISTVHKIAQEYGIKYTHAPVSHKPVASVGSLITLLKGSSIIKNYIKENNIDIVMPRSNFPAFMVNKIKNLKAKIVFDADGLALEERVDFAGLSKNSLLYKLLSRVELKMLTVADAVLVRSNKSTTIHLKKIGVDFKNKFFKVLNGRNVSFFEKKLSDRNKIRAQYGVNENDTLFVYCGSLGPQYGWDEMLKIFTLYLKERKTATFLILSGNSKFAVSKLPDAIKNAVIVKSVPFAEVPAHLSAADIAFAIRKPTFSMQGVSPIKLGEYLLMELPTIASKGIGDTDEILNNLNGTFIFDHSDTENIKNAVIFAQHLKRDNYMDLRALGITHFSLEESAKSYLNAFEFIT